ncbi:MAG: Fis family transcriptional regulator [Deltaproteobacteria bacterium]|nr:Fis family transcriptional regulator [Deltaproteobacteria bacterium]
MRHGKIALIALTSTLVIAAFNGCLDSQDRKDGDGTADGSAGTGEDGGTAADGGAPSGSETGRMVGMTEAHNRHRRAAETDTPIPDLVWAEEIAAVAQAYSEKLAAEGCDLVHSSGDYGENLYWQSGLTVTPADVVKSWHDEIECYTHGTFMEGDNCDEACVAAMNSSGCGHYTQVVWRDTHRLGCGMAACDSGAEIWTCNYDPPGNYVGELPF